MTNLPEKYAWIKNLNPIPRTIAEGLKHLGTREVVGKGSNKTIMDWRDELNLAGVKIAGYSDDDIPWCGLFVAQVVKEPLWARNWAKYGVAVKQAHLGDVLVFARNGGGHVGFYMAEDATAYHVLGGNQGNAVTITRIAKNRCIAKRRPRYDSMPAAVKQYVVAASGSLSNNEA